MNLRDQDGSWGPVGGNLVFRLEMGIAFTRVVLVGTDSEYILEEQVCELNVESKREKLK
jgi:hypothetical protein